jgi:hypothetical protein
MRTYSLLILLIISLIFLFSCGSNHIDKIENENVINYGDFGFRINKTYNHFYSRVKIKLKADSDVSYYQHYDIRVPKNIKKWLYSGTTFIIEYDDGQIISIDAETEIEKEKITAWKEIPENEDLLSDISNDYTSQYKKRWDYSAKTKKNRTTKVYNDGHSTLIIFNIKKENVKEFSAVKNSLEYIASNRS